MEREPGGCWSVVVDAVPAGARYGFLLSGQGPFPDPCSRSQPDGVHALSEVVDPAAFPWTDGAWTPPAYRDLVIYECHAGTFTPGGTFESAIERMPYLRDLGVNAIELMPVAAFPGRWNWGYDGVALFAPAASYGGPRGLRALVDAAHAAGIAVILDVVYNHFGPDGNYAHHYAPYTDESRPTPWGAAIDFTSAGVRRFYRENLLHWIHEYHVDGFRFDATHAIVDPSPTHILAELADAVREHVPVYLVAESNENDVRYLRPRAAGGFGFDGVWADDFHHAVRAALCGDREGWFANYDGSIEEVAATLSRGFLFEGQVEPATGRRRGTPARDVPWGSFVYCIQNHDQVGNRAFGDRITSTASRADIRAASLVLLLLPQVPLLFQGQEYFASTPFQYFTDHKPALGRLVTEGRRREFARFAAFSDSALRGAIPDPQDPRTFARSKLNWHEAAFGIGRLALDLHRALLRLRREDPVLAVYRGERLPIDAEAHGRVLVVRLGASGKVRWIVANFGEPAEVPLPGPALAEVVLHTDEPRFGGTGRSVSVGRGRISLPAHTAAFLSASL
jgi:maltooligosyltrehalose trehalohydrolase